MRSWELTVKCVYSWSPFMVELLWNLEKTNWNRCCWYSLCCSFLLPAICKEENFFQLQYTAEISTSVLSSHLSHFFFHITGQWGWKSKKGELVDSSENVQVLPGSGTESQDYAEQTEKIYWESQVSYYILLPITLDFNSKLQFSLSVIMCSTIVTI